MKIWLAIILAVVAYTILQAAFTGYYTIKGTHLPKNIYPNAEYGSSKNPPLTVLLAGDSIAAGVGASGPETGMAGRIGTELGKKNHVTFTNTAVSGSRMADLLSAPIPSKRQNITILFISSNDLFHFTNPEKFESDTEAVLNRYEKISDRVILVGPGNIGGATAIPLVIKPIYNLKRQAYVNIMEKVASPNHPKVTYINAKKHDYKLKEYGHTEALDGFHPNDNGHKFWADIILDSIR